MTSITVSRIISITKVIYQSVCSSCFLRGEFPTDSITKELHPFLCIQKYKYYTTDRSWDLFQVKFMASEIGQENFTLVYLNSLTSTIDSFLVLLCHSFLLADSKIITIVASLRILSIWIQPHYQEEKGSRSSSSSVMYVALPKYTCLIWWQGTLLTKWGYCTPWYSGIQLVISWLALLLYCIAVSEGTLNLVYISSYLF